MNRISLAFRCFFGLLFGGRLSDALVADLGLARKAAPKPPAPPSADHSDGAVQLLAILQRDSRLVDFLMEDITAYDDEQVGAAVRSMHDQCRDSLKRYVELGPVIDGVEGTPAKIAGTPAAQDPAGMVKFIGNVPAGTPKGGTLRHKGWLAGRVTVPAPKHGTVVVAPAEIEIE